MKRDQEFWQEVEKVLDEVRAQPTDEQLCGIQIIVARWFKLIDMTHKGSTMHKGEEQDAQ